MLINKFELNLSATTPITPPVITNQSLSLTATAAATLSKENARSVKAMLIAVVANLL